MTIVLGIVGALHVLLYFTLQRGFHELLPKEIGKALTFLAGGRVFGMYLVVVRMRLPSFAMVGVSWLLFTELSAKVISKMNGIQDEQANIKPN